MRSWYRGEPAPPELLPDRDWRRLGDTGRLADDEARLNHHSRLLVVATPVIRKVITEGRRLSYLNRNADSGRCGLILSGPGRSGCRRRANGEHGRHPLSAPSRTPWTSSPPAPHTRQSGTTFGAAALQGDSDRLPKVTRPQQWADEPDRVS